MLISQNFINSFFESFFWPLILAHSMFTISQPLDIATRFRGSRLWWTKIWLNSTLHSNYTSALLPCLVLLQSVNRGYKGRQFSEKFDTNEEVRWNLLKKIHFLKNKQLTSKSCFPLNVRKKNKKKTFNYVEKFASFYHWYQISVKKKKIAMSEWVS